MTKKTTTTKKKATKAEQAAAAPSGGEPTSAERPGRAERRPGLGIPDLAPAHRASKAQ